MSSVWEPFAHVLLIVAVGTATLVAFLALVIGVIAEGTRTIARLLGYRPPTNPRHARRQS